MLEIAPIIKLYWAILSAVERRRLRLQLFLNATSISTCQFQVYFLVPKLYIRATKNIEINGSTKKIMLDIC